MERIKTNNLEMLDIIAETLERAGGCEDCIPDTIFEVRATTDSFWANWTCEPPMACTESCKRILEIALQTLQRQFDVVWD
jgi:hypothetical protein